VQEIAAAARYLKEDGKRRPAEVGVVGWCLGGGLSLSTAAYHADLIGAAVAFYGRPLTASDAARLKVPVLGLSPSTIMAYRWKRCAALKRNWNSSMCRRSAHLSWHIACFLQRHAAANLRGHSGAGGLQKTLAWFREYLVDG